MPFATVNIRVYAQFRQVPHTVTRPTSSQEAMCRQQQLGRDLHIQLIFGHFEYGKILMFPLVVRYSPFRPIIS